MLQPVSNDRGSLSVKCAYGLEQYGHLNNSAHSVSCFVLFCKVKRKIGKNRCCCCFRFGSLNFLLFGKELFIRFTLRVFHEHLLMCVCASFPFGFSGGKWDVMLLVPDHCGSFYLSQGYLLSQGYRTSKGDL